MGVVVLLSRERLRETGRADELKADREMVLAAVTDNAGSALQVGG